VATKRAQRGARSGGQQAPGRPGSRRPAQRAPQPRQPVEPGQQGTEIERRLDAQLLRRGWWFDTDEADRVCAFFERVVTHSKGEWQGQNLELAAWQRRALRRLFGWRRPDGTRRYRRSQWWIPKKNGKSFIAAGIALYLVAFDGEAGAEVYSAAGNREQAGLVFDEAKKMVRASKELSEHVECFKDSLLHASTLSKYQALSAKPGTKHGFNVHGLVVDEVHEFKSRELYDFLSSGTGARRQPLEVVISTAGADVGSFGYELWEGACKLRDGIHTDPETMVVIYAAGSKDRWDDERTWAKANPNLGISPKLDFLRGEVAKCRRDPGFIPSFKRLYLNIWTSTADAYFDIVRWDACPRCPARLLPYRRRRCWGGLDLSKTTDLSSLVLVFERDDGLLDVLPFFWCPEEHARERSVADGAQYPLWIEQGLLRVTPGNIVDYRFIRRDIQRIARVVDLQEIAFDKKYATELVQNLQDEDGITMVEHGQQFLDMSAPTMELQRRITGALIAHPGHALLTWNISNVAVRTDAAGNVKPDKKRSRRRIDGAVALVMGLGRATLGASSKSVYEDRGIATT